MPKFYCEYCGIYLTHSSPAGRKQHNLGRKHINAKVDYYQKLVREHFFQPPAFLIQTGQLQPGYSPAPAVPVPPNPGLPPRYHAGVPLYDGGARPPVMPPVPPMPGPPVHHPPVYPGTMPGVIHPQAPYPTR